MRAIGWRKIVFAVWLLLWPLLLVIHFYPIRIAAVRLGLLLIVFLIWLGILLLCWNGKSIRWTWFFVTLIFAICCLWPKRAYNPQTLREEYIRSLQTYKGVPYVWGGESKRGIDCSGLMRCALIDAEVKRGIATLNPSLVRAGFSLWWNDCSARAMKEEFQARTRLLFTAASINQINDAKIKPGDIAVTSNGVHVLAYIGGKTWIEADPNEIMGDQVIEVKTPTRSAWFNMPVHVMRWRELE